MFARDFINETLLPKLERELAIGDVFTTVTGSAITGQFASPILTINSKEHFEIKYNPTSVTLTVVAGP